MRPIAALLLSALLAGCSAQWRPAPVAGLTEPSAVIEASTAADWQPIADDDLMVMDLTGGGRIVIQLAPDFAPIHVANIRAFARGGWWNDATIYRVQDNYVAQWGNGDAQVPLPPGVVQRPPAEYSRSVTGLQIRPLGSPDAYAAAVGHAGGWPVAYDLREGQAWLTHCYASVGVGRDLAPDTGTGGELYAVIGHAPRHLDRNIATVARIIEGMALLSSRPRGTGNLGFYRPEAGERPVAIERIAMVSDLPAAERPRFETMRTQSAAFSSFVAGRANRGGTFFNRPAGGVDVCNVVVPVRRRAGS